MNVLLFHPQVDVMNMVGFCLESQNGITTFKADKFHEVVDLFLDLVFYPRLLVCGMPMWKVAVV